MPGRFTPSSHYHMRRKVRGRRTVVGELFRTHRFTIDDTTIDTDLVFPNRERDITIATKIQIGSATTNGVIFDLGGGTTGLTLVVDADEVSIYAGSTGDDGAVAIANNLPTTDGARVDLVAAVRPGTGEVRIWVNGQLSARATAVNGALPNGWAGTDDGAVGVVNGTVHPDIPGGNAVDLVGATIVESVSVFLGQLPHNFD